MRKVNEKTETEAPMPYENIHMGFRKLHENLDALGDALSDLKIEMKRRFDKLDVSMRLDKVWYVLILGAQLVVIARC
jgi:hypothetical protein